jgi:CheY-like chemotaxis protein
MRGYNVITAVSGAEAVQTSREYEGEISLLLSDFQMPEMSGTKLATQITVERP